MKKDQNKFNFENHQKRAKKLKNEKNGPYLFLPINGLVGVTIEVVEPLDDDDSPFD